MERTYDEVWGPFCDWYLNLGAEARYEVLTRLGEIRLPGTPGWGKCDTTFMVDYSNRMYEAGRKVVYVWVTEGGEIFYIGRGTQERASNIYSRGEGFKSKVDAGRCKVYILCAWAKESVADDIETMLIYRALEMGCHLQNRYKLLQPADIECLKQTGAPFSTCRYPEWVEQYSDVLNAFVLLSEHCKALGIGRSTWYDRAREVNV